MTRVIVISDPAYIQKWQSLEYPLVEKIAADATSRHAVNEYAAKEAAKYQPMTRLWNQHIGDQDIERWRATTIGLGTVINLIALDTLLSGEHQAHAVAQLEQGVFWAPDELQRRRPGGVRADRGVAVSHRRGRRSRIGASRRTAEYVIDWFQQHAGNEAIAKGLIDESQQVLTYMDAHGKRQPIPVFPKSWAMPGGKRKIPRTRLASGDYLLVETRGVPGAQRPGGPAGRHSGSRAAEGMAARAGHPARGGCEVPTDRLHGSGRGGPPQEVAGVPGRGAGDPQEGLVHARGQRRRRQADDQAGDADYSAAKAAAGEPQDADGPHRGSEGALLLHAGQ